MIIIYKNRGILIPVYFFASVAAVAILSQILKTYVGGWFAFRYDFQIILGIGTFLSGLWTYFTSKDYIIVNGKKEQIYLNNHFFFLSLTSWSYILGFGGILVIISGILETLDRNIFL